MDRVNRTLKHFFSKVVVCPIESNFSFKKKSSCIFLSQTKATNSTGGKGWKLSAFQFKQKFLFFNGIKGQAYHTIIVFSST